MGSEDESDSSSVRSASSSASPAASFHTPPNVDQLVHYFGAAKRALSSTNYVVRANELVTSSRASLEETARLHARNAFARSAIDEQVETVRHVRAELVGAGEDAGDEFRVIIERLDAANDRLERTLDALRTTVADHSLQASVEQPVVDPLTEDDVSGADTVKQKTLFDFIDETNHSDLQSSLRGLIDSYQDSRADLDDTILRLDDSLRAINLTFPEEESGSKSPALGNIYDDPPLSIPRIFHGMEDHAAEMAGLLESLIAHYDLCVSALKHTEGGGEAARKSVQQAEGTVSKNGTFGIEESLYLKTVPEPISDEERGEMRRVLQNDAHEVEDVVEEIRDRNREQESLHEQLLRHADAARTRDRRVRHVLDLLHETNDIHLPSYAHALNTFKASWARIQQSIESQTSELTSLNAFYDGFLSGYAKLLQEVERRKESRRQMRKVAEKARKELQRLAEADRGLREDFMEETGKFLPLGIWDGLRNENLRWEIAEVRREE